MNVEEDGPPLSGAAATERPAVRIPPGWIRFPESSPFLDRIGPLHQQEGGGPFRLGLGIGPAHCNRRGVAHGGLLMTLADLQLGYSHRAEAPEAAAPLVTVAITAEFLATARLGDWVEAETEFRQRGRSLAFANCYLRVGTRAVLRASATFKAATLRPDA